MEYDLINSYNEIDEENRLQSTQARKVEFVSTIEALDQFIIPGIKIFDCGCGVGIYSIHYAKRGAKVTALDIVPKHISRLQEIVTTEKLSIDCHLGDACNLSEFNSNEFDLTLCLGPLYHLISEEAQDSCIKECIRVTKENGVIAFAYISPFSVFPCVVRGDSSRAENKLVDIICENKKISSKDDLCFWTDNYYYTPDEIEKKLSEFGLEIIDHLATDGQSIAFQSMVNQLSPKEFETWLYYHKKTCRERSILGSSNHGLVLLRKK